MCIFFYFYIQSFAFLYFFFFIDYLLLILPICVIIYLVIESGDWVSYLALYRKYRPTNFTDLVGQSEVVRIIKNEVINQKISHAYLFSGPRGTGKTSTAKIIARMINCSELSSDGIPCGHCENCLNFDQSSDIVEIDAASNNGVDEIRELRDKVNLVPTLGKYKVYIIDEVHMLTTQAFNALLKTLEEPPSHVIFILATTEFYKIPVTVVSRCQKFQFQKFSNDDIVKKLKKIADQELISASDDVLFEIARLSDGGLRDAINMLDQLSAYKTGELDVQDVYKLSGVVSYSEFRKLLKSIFLGNFVEIVDFMEQIDKSGNSLDRFVEDLISFLKDILVFKNTKSLNFAILEKRESIEELSEIFSEQDLYNLIISLNDQAVRIKSSSFGKILLVTEFIKLSSSFSEQKNIIDHNLTVDTLDNKLSSDSSLSSNSNNFDSEINNFETNGYITDKIKKIRINNTFATASKDLKDVMIKKWDLVQEKLSNDPNYVSIAGMMSDVEILVVGEENIIFLAQYDSLLERLFSQIQTIERLLFDVFSVDYKVIFLLKDEWQYERGKYISNLKSGIQYEYIFEEDSSKININSVENSVQDDISKLVSILGNDIISYE